MPNVNVLEQKKQIVADLVETLKSAQAGVLVDYRGITVEQDTNLRKELREAGVIYKVYNSNEGFLGTFNKTNIPEPVHSATFNSFI